MNTSLRPFFYFKKITPWEKIFVGIYLFITVALYFLYLAFSEDRINILIAYPATSQLFIIVFLYASLRNFGFYLIWLGFGLLHLVAYEFIKNDTYPKVFGGHASSVFIYTIPILLFYQVLRYVSRKIQLREFVFPSKGSNKDLFDNIKVSVTDKVISFSYIGLWAVLVYLFH